MGTPRPESGGNALRNTNLSAPEGPLQGPVRAGGWWAARALASALALGLVLPSCYIDTQRFPGILKPIEDPLPEGAKATFLRGPEEAFVIRHSDSVSVRIAETMSTIDLRWYDKRTRIPAGSWVYSRANGHAVVLLPGATSITLRGSCAGVVGSESRREPAFTFVDVETASITFGEIGQVELPGGALLEAYSGPFVLERVRDDVLRVSNRSGETGSLAYRESILSIAPSETIDLALLDAGTAPFEIDPNLRSVLTDGGRLELRGGVDVLASTAGARLRATGDGASGASEITGYGLVLRLDPGDEVLLEGLGSEDERKAAAEAAAEGQ